MFEPIDINIVANDVIKKNVIAVSFESKPMFASISSSKDFDTENVNVKFSVCMFFIYFKNSFSHKSPFLFLSSALNLI